MKTKYITELGLLSAFAIVLSYVESMIPVMVTIPGIKLGLANFLIVICLYLYGIKEAVIVNFIRIAVVGVMFGNLFSILFSIAGAAVSMTVMILCRKTDFFSVTGVSVAGGVSHNIAQIIVAAVVVKTAGILYYIPALVIGGAITGMIIGILSGLVMKHIRNGAVNKNDSIY